LVFISGKNPSEPQQYFDELSQDRKLNPVKERNTTMKNVQEFILKLRIWNDTKGQDLIEYALLAGFVAVAAAAFMPGISQGVSTVFVKVGSVMTAASS
jgi:pilus assembly protein Flp/PilA